MLKDGAIDFETFKIIISTIPVEPEIKQYNYYEEYLKEMESYDEGNRQKNNMQTENNNNILVTENLMDENNRQPRDRLMYDSNLNIARNSTVDIPEESIPNKLLPKYHTVVRKYDSNRSLEMDISSNNNTEFGKTLRPADFTSYEDYIKEYERERSYLKHIIYQLQKQLENFIINRSSTPIGNNINNINNKVEA